MKEFNFWCKENTDFGKCDNKKCGFFECGCYGYCEECVYHCSNLSCELPFARTNFLIYLFQKSGLVLPPTSDT